MDLYSFPKEMLIKLISTIGNDLNNENNRLKKENDVKDEIIKQMLNQGNPIKLSLLKCNVKDCDEFSVRSIYEYDSNVKPCDSHRHMKFCGIFYCNKHSSNFTRYNDKKIKYIYYYCNECKEKIPEDLCMNKLV